MIVNLVVDRSVWSLVLRRSQVEETHPCVQAFRTHIKQEDGVFLLGNILQELLDGVKNQRMFDNLVKILQPFPLLAVTRDTYMAASQLRNTCRSKGIQAGHVDCLIAAACIENGFPLLTTDRDFSYIANHSDLVVLSPD